MYNEFCSNKNITIDCNYLEEFDMEKLIGGFLGLMLWSGLLLLQGTPAIDKDIAAEAFLSTNPSATVLNVTAESAENTDVFAVAFANKPVQSSVVDTALYAWAPEKQQAADGIVNIAKDNGRFID